MMRIFRRRVLPLALLFATACVAQQKPVSWSDFNGRYVVTDIVGYERVSEGLPEAKRLLGKTIAISTGVVAVDDDACRATAGFTLSEVETAAALEKEYSMDVLAAGLPTKTLLLGSEECPAVFRVDAHRILFGWNGIVVRAISDDGAAVGKKPGRAGKSNG